MPKNHRIAQVQNSNAIGLRRVILALMVVVFSCCAAAAANGPVISGLLVNGIASNKGAIGDTLTIQGSGFGATIGFSFATLNGIAIAGDGVKPKSWSNTSIVTVIPETATSGPVIVTLLGGASNSVKLYIRVRITGVSPSSGPVGSGVTIGGRGFGATGGAVTFNGVTAAATGWTDASILATVPNGATAGPIVVTVEGQRSNGVLFTPTPEISGLSPNSGEPGTDVTVSGSSFGSSGINGEVTFAGVLAPVKSWSDHEIIVSAPSGGITGDVVVSVNGEESAGATFTYGPDI
jgi:hypothetical protein